MRPLVQRDGSFLRTPREPSLDSDATPVKRLISLKPIAQKHAELIDQTLFLTEKHRTLQIPVHMHKQMSAIQIST